MHIFCYSLYILYCFIGKMSTFDGILKECPLISIDNFVERNYKSTVFFLSHCHEDHMTGLDTDEFYSYLTSRNDIKIYMSEVSRFLILKNPNRSRFARLLPYMCGVPVEHPTTIFIPNEEVEMKVLVTLIPAGHCPGSVMFLYEGPYGNVLYTGDFRYSVGSAARLKPLHKLNGMVKTINSMYLDTTFCDGSLSIPSRHESMNAIILLVDSWLQKAKNNLVYLITPANYGYEAIYVDIYQKLRVKAHVKEWKYDIYRTIPEIEEAVTNDASSTRFHACFMKENQLHHYSEDTERYAPCNCLSVSTLVKIRVIKPSAMIFSMNQSLQDVVEYDKTRCMHRVHFSTHSSFEEVADMVNYLQPQRVYPNVVPLGKTEYQMIKHLMPLINSKSVLANGLKTPIPPLGSLKSGNKKYEFDVRGDINKDFTVSPVANSLELDSLNVVSSKFNTEESQENSKNIFVITPESSISVEAVNHCHKNEYVERSDEEVDAIQNQAIPSKMLCDDEASMLNKEKECSQVGKMFEASDSDIEVCYVNVENKLFGDKSSSSASHILLHTEEELFESVKIKNRNAKSQSNTTFILLNEKETLNNVLSSSDSDTTKLGLLSNTHSASFILDQKLSTKDLNPYAHREDHTSCHSVTKSRHSDCVMDTSIPEYICSSDDTPDSLENSLYLKHESMHEESPILPHCSLNSKTYTYERDSYSTSCKLNSSPMKCWVITKYGTDSTSQMPSMRKKVPKSNIFHHEVKRTRLCEHGQISDHSIIVMLLEEIISQIEENVSCSKMIVNNSEVSVSFKSNDACPSVSIPDSPDLSPKFDEINYDSDDNTPDDLFNCGMEIFSRNSLSQDFKFCGTNIERIGFKEHKAEFKNVNNSVGTLGYEDQLSSDESVIFEEQIFSQSIIEPFKFKTCKPLKKSEEVCDIETIVLSSENSDTE